MLSAPPPLPTTGNSGSSGGGHSSSSTYSITVKNSDNGTVTSSQKTAKSGTTITLTAAPEKNYVLDTLKAVDSKNKEITLTATKDGKYTFSMPRSNVTVTATFKGNFTDVPNGSYFEEAVDWAVKKGITTGTSAALFNPDGICTRAQAVTFLWRAAGQPRSPVQRNAVHRCSGRQLLL